jgi:hypothetical protein
MAEKPQFYQDTLRVSRVAQIEKKMLNIRDNLITIKAESIALKSEIDADTGSSSDMTTLGNQLNTFVNHASYTDFVTFVTNSIES